MAATAVAATLTALGMSTPVNAAPIKGSLVASVTDQGTGLTAPVQGRQFDVKVNVVDLAESPQPLAVSKATTIELIEVSGDGTLGGNLKGVIPKNTSTGTISGAIYSTDANGENGVKLQVRVVSGVALNPAPVTENVAATAVREPATDSPLEVVDRNCVDPTPERPTCGLLLLPNGVNDDVIMALGQCLGVGTPTFDCSAGGVRGLLVTAVADLGNRYSEIEPATFVLKCDKSKCGNGGVLDFPPLVDVSKDNTGALVQPPACPSKGVLGDNQPACWDQVQSKKDIAGDVHTYILFDVDFRFSHP
jgi:hypothetical protein